MNISEIRQLAGILREENLTRLDVTEGSTRVVLEAGATHIIQSCAQNEAGEGRQTRVQPTGGNAVTSPLVGTVYLAPGLESEPFVCVGARVSEGDTLCIVESMKMFNEIEASASGTVKEVCVKNGQRVDFGQCLFVLDTEGAENG